MIPSKFYNYHFLIFFGMALLLTPPKMIHQTGKVSEITKQQPDLAMEKAADLVHSEILFKY